MGCSGAGKSTLSRQLGRRLDIPVVHLDSLFWKPGWVESSPAEFTERVRDALVGDQWIVDGTYVSTQRLVWPRADTIVFLDFPRAVCLWRVMLRYLSHRGRTRQDMTPGCPETLDFEFVEYIWTFSADYRPRIIARLEHLRPDQRLIVLKGPADAARFMRDICIEQSSEGTGT